MTYIEKLKNKKKMINNLLTSILKSFNCFFVINDFRIIVSTNKSQIHHKAILSTGLKELPKSIIDC